jgi:hypothetical protein
MQNEVRRGPSIPSIDTTKNAVIAVMTVMFQVHP